VAAVRRLRYIAGTALATALLVLAAPVGAGADTPPAGAADAAPAQPGVAGPHRAATEAEGAAGRDPSSAFGHEGLPLSRAGVEARIESIDPADWLGRFGEVDRRRLGAD